MSTPESGQSIQQPKAKDESRRELKVKVNKPNGIDIRNLSKMIPEDDLQAYFSQFGEVETCFSFKECSFVTFKSPDAVKQVLNSAPHYLIGDRITNENAELFAEMKKLMRTKCQRYPELKVDCLSENMILIDGLSKEISQDAIRAYFSKFGQVGHSGINYFPQGYVSFKSSDAIKQVINSGPHYIIGDRITNENIELFALVKKAMPIKDQSRQELKVNPVFEKMISINLSEEISQDAIRAYFSKFGQVELCKNGYVSFNSPNAVNEVLNSAPHYIIDGRITNENDEFALMKKSMHTNDQSHPELEVTISKRVKDWFSEIYSRDKYALFTADMYLLCSVGILYSAVAFLLITVLKF
ncbi:RNA recognition motif domain-containing protein [Ditylenchus destructor]|nr:RNA recognition motif domain-containing protein [Ditylenchus destructor]